MKKGDSTDPLWGTPDKAKDWECWVLMTPQARPLC